MDNSGTGHRVITALGDSERYDSVAASDIIAYCAPSLGQVRRGDERTSRARLFDPEDFAQIVSDLIGDLAHLAHRHGHDIRDAISRGLSFFEEETASNTSHSPRKSLAVDVFGQAHQNRVFRDRSWLKYRVGFRRWLTRRRLCTVTTSSPAPATVFDALNRAASFIPIDPAEPETLPCVVIGGAQVYTYWTEARLTVAVHVDTGEIPEQLLSKQDTVPLFLRLTVNGDLRHHSHLP